MLKNENSVENTSKEESRFEEFVTQALRLHRRGSFENLLAQHLIVAVNSPPVQKIRLVCEAAFMVPKDKLNVDMHEVETIYVACLSLLHTPEKTDFISVAWAFPQTEENYARFIKPWHHRHVPIFYTYSCGSERDEKRETLKKAQSEAEEFFLITSNLGIHLASLQVLKSEFVAWAVPRIMQVFEVVSRLVDPDLYKQVLESLKPGVKAYEGSLGSP
jgi:hypothetical protein